MLMVVYITHLAYWRFDNRASFRTDKQVEDDAATLMAKLEANNSSKQNIIQLTADGKVMTC